jgi:hypothetical protein
VGKGGRERFRERAVGYGREKRSGEWREWEGVGEE